MHLCIVRESEDLSLVLSIPLYFAKAASAFHFFVSGAAPGLPVSQGQQVAAPGSSNGMWRWASFYISRECSIVQFHFLYLTKMSLALSTSSKYLKGIALCTVLSLRLRSTPNGKLFDLETLTHFSNEAEIAHVGPTSSISLLSKNFTRSKRRLAGKRVLSEDGQ